LIYFKAGAKEFKGTNARKVSDEEKATFEKIKKGIMAKVKRIGGMEEGDEKEKEKKMLKAIIANKDINSLFGKLGLNVKNFTNDVMV
jgi:hypothetical protein